MRALRTERAQFLVDNLDLPEAAQVEGARWEYFQIAHLEDDGTFRIENKSRQIAWSWLVAAEAVAEGILSKAGSVFVSINLNEAKEKIRYARQVIEALPARMRPGLVTDSKLELEFENGARLISMPSTPPRGKAQMNVYLDEYAHVRDDAAIYTAGLPMISKGGRRLRIGSSPMGASGRFWEVFTEAMRPYPGYSRKRTPWWEVQAFCLNVREARRLAPGMPTAHRVEVFGNDRIKAIYANMPEDDFRQEYEGEFVDESTAWITWEEIRTAQESELVCFLSRDVGGVERAREAIDELFEAMRAGLVERLFAAGYDVGRTRNTSELFLVGVSTTLSRLPLRLAVTLDNCEFNDQLEILKYAMERLPIMRLLIDRNGIGLNLAENMERAFPVKVEGVNFTNASKTAWATEGKMLIQQHKTPLPVDRDIAYQIHSIKRSVTAAKNNVFDTDRSEKHHADKFWAWVLALWAVKSPLKEVSAW